MKPAARNAPVVVLLLILSALAAAARPALAATKAGAATVGPSLPTQPRDLLAHGTNQYVWAADVVPVLNDDQPGVQTIVRFRTAGDEVRWQNATALAARVMSLSNRGTELLVVLEDGGWQIVTDDQARTGNALPDDATVMALAGDGDDIWAVAERKTSSSPATTTTTSPTSTLAATQPAPPRNPLGLYLLRGGAWSDVGDLPVPLRKGDVAALSLAVLDGHLNLAVVNQSSRAIRVFVREGDRWTGGDDVETLGANAQMKLLDVRGRPALWVAEEKSPGRLRFRAEGRWQPAVHLQPSPKLKDVDQFALVHALGQLRMLASDGKGRLVEQLYTPDGKLEGGAVEAVTIPTDVDKRFNQGIEIIVLTVLVVWMLGALRQRPNLQEAIRRIDQLNLAPLGRRFIGGLIDMIPLIVGFIVGTFAVRGAGKPPPGMVVITLTEFLWVAGGVVVYFLHVTITELILRRSIGKILTGTRIAALDGSRPRVSQVLVRNVMRIVDLVLVFVPLMSVLSPLRQRVGDMTAGTIVVMNTATSPPPTEPPTPPPAGEA